MRKKKFATIALRKPSEGHRFAKIEERFAEATPFLEEAANEKADFVCLPEFFAVHGVPGKHEDLADTETKGPIAQFCSAQAAKHGFHLVASLPNLRPRGFFNTGVIFGRDGKLLAEYDKVHPAPDETALGGDLLPVFDIEGLRVGMQICFDLNYPEGIRALALQGADVVFWPTMWDGPTEHYIDCVTRSRALENYLFLVCSGYTEYGDGSWQTHGIRRLSPTGIISWDGNYLARTGVHPGVTFATLDADEKRELQCDRTDHFRMRRPGVYKKYLG